MQQKNIAFLILLAGILIAAPLVVSSDHGSGFHLVSCAVHTGAEGKKIPGMLSPMTDICSICDLLKLLEKGSNFLWLYLTIPIATVMLLYGGFLMIMGSFGGQGSSITKGKSVLKNAFLGLAIVFLAWIGVDSILKIMGAQQSGKFGPWNKIVCDEEAAKIKFIGGPVDVIPPEYQCPAGITAKFIDGKDVCDSIVQKAMVTKSSIGGSGSGQCSPANIKALNDNYGSLINTVASSEGLNAEQTKQLKAICLIESSGNPNAVSPKNAAGICQVIPSTAKSVMGWSGKSDAEIIDLLKKPENGLRAGAKTFKGLLNSPKVGGKFNYALVGYNAAPSALLPSNDCLGTIQGLCPKNPGGLAETLAYVPKVENCFASLP